MLLITADRYLSGKLEKIDFKAKFSILSVPYSEISQVAESLENADVHNIVVAHTGHHIRHYDIRLEGHDWRLFQVIIYSF